MKPAKNWDDIVTSIVATVVVVMLAMGVLLFIEAWGEASCEAKVEVVRPYPSADYTVRYRPCAFVAEGWDAVP